LEAKTWATVILLTLWGSWKHTEVSKYAGNRTHTHYQERHWSPNLQRYLVSTRGQCLGTNEMCSERGGL
jgi:hypothetical protein